VLTSKPVKLRVNNPAFPLEIELPLGLEPGVCRMKDLTENPMTRAKIELGRQLFFEKRMSEDSTISCASCHEPDKGYTVATAVASGVKWQKGRRNPPSLLNRIMLGFGEDRQFWDGRATSVEDALLHALKDPAEMAASPEATIRKLKEIEGYRLQFDRIYGEVTWEAIGDATGCFVRCLVTDSSPYDYSDKWRAFKDLDQQLLDEDPELAERHQRFKTAAEAHPMSDSAYRGESIFFGNKAWCSGCHNGVTFTDELYHNIGIGQGSQPQDQGRFETTKLQEDQGAFKTPSIRAAIWTAPYMHDGSVTSLKDVVDYYAHEGAANRNLDYRFNRIAGEELTEQDKEDLVEFVKACSGSLPKVETGRLPE
jgi:cytochrome c peroxidase